MPEALEVVTEDRVAAVVRAAQVADPAGTASALAEAGVRCVEFTFTIPGALAIIEKASGAAGAVIGAGTVRSADQARQAIDAGARFIVSPGLVPGIEEPCAATGIPLILGALTPTEIIAAMAAGAAAVKLFPASLGGPGYVRQLLAPFPGLPIVASGGVGASAARGFLDAGAVAVMAGSELVPRRAVEEGDAELLHRSARDFLSHV
jgi:2-dehydro-3-deoxyphosphogluconate aldolase / (4S)-4-hydroxy-2-oxoglutarate aldolase